jgi:hypothetical protein
VRFKVHFGGYVRDQWSPIHVGIYVESPDERDEWKRRIEAAAERGLLPEGNLIFVSGKQTVEARREFPWKPGDLTPSLVERVVETLLQYEAALGVNAAGRGSTQ